MEVRDLGDLEGPVLVYGGPLSNLQATLALFYEAGRRGIPAERRICTGDTVGYCGEPRATVAILQKDGGTVIAGNCEKQLAAGAEDCGCGFDEGTACDLLSRGWYPFAARQTRPPMRAWMEALPDMAVFGHAGKRYAVVHGGATDISRFVWPTDPDGVFREEIKTINALVGDVDVVMAGHCGLAFQRTVDEVLWANAGVIGMPPNDGSPETRYMLIDDDGKVTIERLSYNPRPAVSAMRRNGLTQGYDVALTTGYWPSDDILPPELRHMKTSA